MQTFFRFAALLLAVALCPAQTTPAVHNDIILAAPGYRVPPAALDVAPGQLIVLHVHGIVTSIDSNIAPIPGPAGYPHDINGISVDLIQGKAATATSLELRGAYQTHCMQPCTTLTGITLQIPFTLATGFGVTGDPIPYLRISENGKAVGGVSLHPVTDNVHALNTCDDTQVYISAAYSVPQNACFHAVMVGNALNSLYNLAHGGNELAVWLYGMGAKTDAAPDCCTSPEQLSRPVQPFLLNYDFRPNAPAFPAQSGFGQTSAPLFAAYIGGGIYQVNFQVPPVPPDTPACDASALNPT
jgi:hypothetical protein